MLLKRERRINRIFAREFDFDLEKFEKDKEKKFFEIDLYNISKDKFARLNYRFHQTKTEIIEKKLKDGNFWMPIKHVFKLSVPGKRVPKGKTFSDEETGYFYLRPTEVKFGRIEKESVPCISAEIYEKLKEYKIISGEIFISVEGTIGKVALINTSELEIGEKNLILSKNFVKLSPFEEINHLFYYYYFYSFIFKAQADREYTIKVIKTLAKSRWNYIKVPNIPLSEQEKIANEIKNELDEQEKIKKIIENERNKIDEIINFQLENLEKSSK